jgi:hypothetical protein
MQTIRSEDIPFIEECGLLKVRQDMNQPRWLIQANIFAVVGILRSIHIQDDSGRRELPIDVVKTVNCQSDLFEVIQTLRSSGSSTSSLNGRKQNRHQNPNDCDNDKKFDQGKTRSTGRLPNNRFETTRTRFHAGRS